MFITLEGIEGSGKTTQMTGIKTVLEAAGHGVVLTREPGATDIGRCIRSILLHPDHQDMSPLCELLLYSADRAQHISQVIVPALAAGQVVVCDRFTDATRVYQGVARGLAPDTVNTVLHMVVETVVPDLTLLFDLDPETGLGRTRKDLEKGARSGRESRFEQESLAFHRAVRQGYLDLAAMDPERFFIIDASCPPQDVSGQIRQGLKARLGIAS